MAEDRRGPIVIRDGQGTLELYPKTINGVEVYAPTAEKSKEIEKRFREMFPPKSPNDTTPSRRRWGFFRRTFSRRSR